MTEIGLLNERSLHASLKDWYASPGDQFEVQVDGYVIDIVRDELLIEIQTASFASIKRKLIDLTGKYQVRLIYPVAAEKWIVKLADHDNEELSRRKSPKRGRIEDVFRELVSFPKLITNPNFSIEVLLIREEERLRRFEGKRNWRRRGWGIDERRLLEIVCCQLFEKPSDWRDLLPDALDDQFTTKDLAETMGVKSSLAQKMAYCLSKVNIIEMTGKKGRFNLYKMSGLY
ncbi:hypothetical protein JXB12_06725 [candidate division KSB1 bacterium]|nr:hypothetical protein [candidate division KSB1 bacterium]